MSYSVGLLMFMAACLVDQVTTQADGTTMRWKQFCDDSLVICTNTYEKGFKNKETINVYYDCIYNVFCERWSEGFHNRQNILGDIQARKEYYDPENREWWKNGAENHRISLGVAIISLVAKFKVLHATLR